MLTDAFKEKLQDKQDSADVSQPKFRLKLRAFPPRTACIIHPQINKPAATALPKAPDSFPHIKANIRPRNKRFHCSHRLAKHRDVRSTCL